MNEQELAEKLNNKLPADGAISAENYSKLVEKHKSTVEELELKKAAGEVANQDPFPGPTIDAFDENGGIIVKTTKGDVVVRSMVSYDLIILKKLDSITWKQLSGIIDENSIKTIEVDDDDMFTLIYQFINPIEKSISLLKKGKDAFKDEAVKNVGCIYKISDITKLTSIVIKQILNSGDTKLQYEAKVEESNIDGGKKK